MCHLNYHFDIYPTHIDVFPPVMTFCATATKPSSSATTELEALVALVNRFATSSLETTRLAVELQGMSRISPHLALTDALAAKLPVVLAAEISAVTAVAATDAAAAAEREEEEYAAAAAADPIFLEAAFPEGSGETWDVAIPGREPGMYRTSAEADALCNGVPNQLKRKKTSRREAIAWYREHYLAGPPNDVQKWTET
ncbi:hypothetical protein B0H13DRAFT_2369773 [Mycena leptocephala]|nr:hypothetical protein B0H13DRAFT_2369773 [Mycena leptocephala]